MLFNYLFNIKLRNIMRDSQDLFMVEIKKGNNREKTSRFTYGFQIKKGEINEHFSYNIRQNHHVSRRCCLENFSVKNVPTYFPATPLSFKKLRYRTTTSKSLLLQQSVTGIDRVMLTSNPLFFFFTSFHKVIS